MRPLQLLLIGALTVIVGCSNKSEKSPPPPPPEIGVVTMKAERVTLSAELAGRTVASVMSDVRPQITGIVRERLFDEGAQVRAGQLLYRIEAASYRAAVAEASAALAAAEAAVPAARLKSERFSELLQIEGVSRQESDESLSSYRQAAATVGQRKATLDTARINLGFTEVRAPISGRIGKSGVTPGALVSAGQAEALATIRALDPIFVDLNQSSAALLRLRKMLAAGGVSTAGTEVGLTLEDGSRYARKGTLKFAEVAVEEATGAVTLRASFPNPESVLLPGMYVRAVVDEAVDPQAVLAPQQGVTRSAKGEATALVVNAEDKVEQRVIKTAQSIGNRWVVSEGLAPGDRLIVEGLARATPGAKVNPVEMIARGANAPALAASPVPAASTPVR